MNRCSLMVRVLLLVFVFGNVVVAQEKPKIVIQDGHSDLILQMTSWGDGTTAATASKDGTIKIWDLPTGKMERTIVDRQGLKPGDAPYGYRAAAFSPNGQEAMVVTSNDELLHFDLKSGRARGRFPWNRSSEMLITDGVYLYTHENQNRSDEIPKLIKTDLKGNIVASYTNPSLDQRRPSLSQGRLAAVLDPAGVAILDSASLKPIFEISIERPVNVALSPDGKKLAASSYKELGVWDVETGTQLEEVVREGAASIRPFWLSADRLLWTTNSGNPEVADVRGLAEIKAGKLVDLKSGDYRPDILTATGDGGLLLTDLDAGFHWLNTDLSLERDFPRESDNASAFFYSLEHQLLITGSGDRSVRAWNLSTGRTSTTFSGLVGAVGLVALSPDGKIVAASDRERVVMWEQASGKKMTELDLQSRTFDNRAVVLTFVDDARLLVADRNDGKMLLFNVTTGVTERSWNLGPSPVFSVQIHPSRRRAVCLSGSDVVEWSLESTRDVARRPTRCSPVAACYDDAGTSVLVFSGLGERRTWDYLEGEAEVQNLPGLNLRIRDAQVCGDSFWLRLEDGNISKMEGEVKLEGHYYSFQAISDTLLVAFSANGGIEFLNPQSGESYGRLVSFKGDEGWVAIAGNGEFDGSEAGFQKLAFDINGTIYGVDQFFQQYFRPGVLSTFGPKASTALRPTAALTATSLKKPPLVSISSPTSGAVLEQDTVAVTIKVVDQGAGLSKVGLFHNGHRLPAKMGKALDAQTYQFEVKAVQGKNELYATAFDQSGTVESKRDRVRFLAPNLAARKPRLHLLAVGVNTYQSGMSLKFAEQDATSVGKLFQSELYDPGERKVLTNAQATLESITREIATIAAASEPQDALVVYLAGHGTVVGETYYFLPHDVDIESDQSLATTALSAELLAQKLSEVPATKQLLVLDSCRSGAASVAIGKHLGARSGLEEVRSQQLLARSTGTFLIAATKAEEYAYEVKELGHGVLTFAMMQVLGEAKGQKEVTANSLIRAVSESVPELSEKHNGVRQQVIQYSSGQDFPLVKR